MAQENFNALGESSFSVNKKVSNRYKMNFGLRARYFLYQSSDFVLNSRQVDFVHFSSYKLDSRQSLSLGIQFRNRTFFENVSNELRITQQYDYRTSHKSSRFGHRIRLEQRIFEELNIFRFRYRFAIDSPLNGEKLDVGEAYIVKSVETVLSVSESIKPVYDIRFNGQVGWLLSSSFRLQIGLEYRIESLSIANSHRLFLLTTGVLNL